MVLIPKMSQVFHGKQPFLLYRNCSFLKKDQFTILVDRKIQLIKVIETH